MGPRHLVPAQYRSPLIGTVERSFRNSLNTALVLGVLILIAVFVVPKPAVEVATVEDVSERLAKLILAKPKPAAPAAPQKLTESRALPDTPAEIAEVAKPTPKPKAKTRRERKPVVAQDRGKQGREQAQREVSEEVSKVTASLDKTLAVLGDALPAASKSSTTTSSPKKRRRVRRGRSAATGEQIAGISSGAAANLGAALEGASVEIGSVGSIELETPAGGSVGGGGGEGGSGVGGELRSTSSLLAVVRRYAAGIQYCYDDRLKHEPDLRGKLVVSISVSADGRVSEAHIVKDALKSSEVRDCVIAQIEGWRFPVIEAGSVSFRTPFVFTPGN